MMPRQVYKEHNKATCTMQNCPLCARATAVFNVRAQLQGLGLELPSDGVSVFVGSKNYPNLNVGILTPPSRSDQSWLYDAPRFWAGQQFQQSKVVELRSMLINSRFKSNVLSARNPERALQNAQELALSSRPVDVDILLKQEPRISMNFSPYYAPMGHTAELATIRLTENPHVPSVIEKVVSDTDLKAAEAIQMLQKRFDENYLTRLLSIGNLGLAKNRKLVPTRNSITAIDDLMGKKLISEIRDSQEAGFQAFFGSFFGNYYLVMLFPEKWGFELFEIMQQGLEYSTDYEGYEGRKDYASNCVGGYYAARLGIAEKLASLKKQAAVLCIRIITPEYLQPLGVWVVREAVRMTMESKPLEFSSRELMLRYSEIRLLKSLSIGIDFILRKSRLLEKIKSQTKLSSFI